MSSIAIAKPKSVRRSAGSSRAKTVAKQPVRVVASSPVAKQMGNGKAKSRSTSRATDSQTTHQTSLGGVSFFGELESVRLPSWVTDLATFRRWAVSDEAPESVPVFYLSGEVWIDMSQEQVFLHVRMKQELLRVLGNLSTESRLEDVFPDGLLLSNVAGNLSGNPDGTYISHESFRTQRVRLIDGRSEGFVEIEGTPDMVLEVVSESSVKKDTEILRDLYWKAGIPEYWIVDGRGEAVEFTILKHTTRGYTTVRAVAGWLKSSVFGKSFRLTRKLNSVGHPDFLLDVK